MREKGANLERKEEYRVVYIPQEVGARDFNLRLRFTV